MSDKAEKVFWEKLEIAVGLMDNLKKTHKFTSRVWIQGAKIALHIRTSHYTEKDRDKIIKIHGILGCNFVKQYTRTNRVKYSGNIHGITVYMPTNIPATPDCVLTTRQKTQKQTFYSCPIGSIKK